MTQAFEPQFWDRMIGYPVMVIIILTMATALQILAGPRVFRRMSRRLIAFFGLMAYALAMVFIGAQATSGAWHATFATFVRFVPMIIPSAMLFCATWKIEHMQIDLPLKWRRNASRPQKTT